jgi:glycolate oxidase FAD binding subunit
MSMALGSPFEVTGAAHLTEGDPAQTMLRIEGFEASVSYRLARLRDLLAGFGEVTITGPFAPAGHWDAVRDLTQWAGTPEDVWRLSVRPSDAPGIIDRLPEPHRSMLDWGGGLIWAAVAPGTDLRAHLGPIKGHATLIRASDATRARIPPFPPEPGPVAALSAGLRAKFDPRGILNPGLMG